MFIITYVTTFVKPHGCGFVRSLQVRGGNLHGQIVGAGDGEIREDDEREAVIGDV
jgi:hypothetical protein